MFCTIRTEGEDRQSFCGSSSRFSEFLLLNSVFLLGLHGSMFLEKSLSDCWIQSSDLTRVQHLAVVTDRLVVHHDEHRSEIFWSPQVVYF